MSAISLAHLQNQKPAETQRELFELAAKHLGYSIEIVGYLGGKSIDETSPKRPVFKISSTSGKSLLTVGATTEETSYLGMKFAVNKIFTNTYLEKHGIPVPVQCKIESVEQIENFLNKKSPLVVKPAASRAGKGIFSNVSTPDQGRQAIEGIREILPTSVIIAEEQIEGKEFRVVVIDGKFEAAVAYQPAEVIGDGVSTLKQLIEKENTSTLRGKNTWLYPIKINTALSIQLATRQLSLKSIPESGASVSLHKAAPISNGGLIVDVTKEVSAENIALFEKIATIMHLNVIGIDVMAPSLSESVQTSGKILEVNGGPDLRVHYNVHLGERRNIAETILRNFFKN